MQYIRVFFLIMILFAPLSLPSVVANNNDEETCELLEKWGEEEEDERETKEVKGTNEFEWIHIADYEISLLFNDNQEGESTYLIHNPNIRSLVREVITPPPELS